MKAQTKAIIASVVVIALALTAVSGVTYSWWSDSESSTINVTTGTLEVSTSNYYVTGSSLKADTNTIASDELPSNISLKIGGETDCSDVNNIIIDPNSEYDDLDLIISYKATFNADVPYRYIINVDTPAGVYTTITIDGAQEQLPYEVQGSGPLNKEHLITVKIDGIKSGITSSAIQFTNYITQKANNATIINISSTTGQPATITGIVTDSNTSEDVPIAASFANVPAEAETFSVSSSTDNSGITTLEFNLNKANGDPIHDTGTVKIKVELPGNVENPRVIYNGSTGSQPTFRGSSYDSTTEKTTVIFETEHFSEYLIFDCSVPIPVLDEEKLSILMSNGVSCELDQDIVISSTIIAKGNLTLNLNNHKISNTVDIWNTSTKDWSLISIRGSDTNLTIQGNGSLDSKENDCYAIDVKDGATCSLNGNANYIGNMHSIYVFKGILKINGGSFSIKQLSSVKEKPYDFVINCYDSSYRDGSAQVYITGGTFEMFNPAANGAESSPGETNFLSEGCSVTKTTIGEKDYYTVFNDFDEALLSAINVNSPLYLGEGTYSIVGKGIPSSFTVFGSGMEKSKIIMDEPSDNIVDGCFKDVCLSYTNADYHGFKHSNNVNYERCMIEGQPFLYSTNTSFKSCTFVQTSNNAYNVWTYGARTVTFDSCIFNSAGKAILIYTEEKNINQTINIENCILNASESVSGKAAIEIDSSLIGAGTFTINIKDTTSEGFDNGSISGNSLWNEKKGNRSTITINEEVVKEAS